MKKIFIVANWKSNKTILQVDGWFRILNNSQLTINKEEKEIIVCPSFTALPVLKSLIISHKSSIKLGAQDISSFDEGAYTGEVNGKQIKEFADFVIIGHSERRKNFFENDNMISKKIEIAIKYGLTPILCISDFKQIHNSKFIIHNSNVIVAYEPLFAIDSGQADTPENANSMAEKIEEELGLITVLYGGSVTLENVKSFTQMPNIDGVLVGGASLDAKAFYTIIQNA